VVDDDPNITYTFKVILEKNAFHVDVYNDSTRAALEFKTGVYDVVLIDIRMPKMNGFELYNEIRKKDTKVKVCFITAFEISKDESGKPSADGLVDFIRKPVDMKELTDRIHYLMSA
jgi:two-component system response regulator ChvI